jgi:2-oxoglutarate ferredoxin oxidoreductase subunit alpha
VIKMADKVLMKGNEAIAEAAIHAGCRHYFGYPITPQTEIAAYLAKKMPKIGGTFLQAESEIAAINMVYGVASTGYRVMTSSSSPGIALKSEGLSYLAGSDLPALVVNVQRGGPGLGGIQPSQSDYFQATKAGGHGDFRMIVLAPASVQEMAELTVKGFELADTYRMTAMILADGTMGQMMEPVALDDLVVNAAPEKPWATTGTKMKRAHNITNSLSLIPEELEQLNFARYERYRTIEENEVMYEEYMMDDAEICIAAFGIAARVSKNAINEARKQGIKVGMIRPITLWPFPKEVFRRAADQVNSFISVELSMGQMIEDVRLATECKKPVTLCNRAGGMIPSPDQVLEAIKNAAKGGEN